MAIVHAAVIAVDDDDVRTVFNPAPIVDAVVGPDSATDGHIAVFSGSTGKIIADGGAPGGGGLLQSATVTLTDDPIKALPTTIFDIVPATETLDYSSPVTQLPMPIFATIKQGLNDNFAPYETVHSPAKIYLVWGDNDFSIAWALEAGTEADAASLFTGGNSMFILTPVKDNELSWQDGLADNRLALWVDNGGDGDFSAGNAGNTIKVTVYYTVVDVS